MTSGRISTTITQVKIDARDKKILAMLAEDSRTPASEIAKPLQLSRDAVSYRITKLQERGVILSCVARIDLKKFGYETYHVFLLLDEKAKDKHQELLSFVKEHKHTKSIMLYTDTWDLEWTLIAQNLKEFDSILTDMLTKYSDVVLQKEKLAVVKEYGSIHLPYCYYGPAFVSAKTEKESEEDGEFKVDETDIKILQQLSIDSRQSSYELGKKIGLSPDAVTYRIRKLISSEIIKSFTTLLNLSKLGLTWYTYAINFKKFGTKDEAKWTEFVKKHAYIIRAVKMFGNWDMMLYIVADSPQNYHKTVKEIKNTFSEIIGNYQTWLAYEEYFFTQLPKAIK